jgi:hypothetical protein
MVHLASPIFFDISKYQDPLHTLLDYLATVSIWVLPLS